MSHDMYRELSAAEKDQPGERVRVEKRRGSTMDEDDVNELRGVDDVMPTRSRTWSSTSSGKRFKSDDLPDLAAMRRFGVTPLAAVVEEHHAGHGRGPNSDGACSDADMADEMDDSASFYSSDEDMEEEEAGQEEEDWIVVQGERERNDAASRSVAVYETLTSTFTADAASSPFAAAAAAAALAHGTNAPSPAGEASAASGPSGPRSALADLPYDVLTVVAGLLPIKDRCRMAQVSKRWHRAACARVNWTVVDLSTPIGNNATTDALLLLFARSPYVRHATILDLDNCRYVTDVGLRIVLRAAPNLDTLGLSGCVALTERGIAAVGELCPKMRRLGLNGLPSVTDASVASLAAGCPLLETLCLGRCANAGDAAVAALSANCRKMTALNLNGVDVSDLGLETLASMTSLVDLNLQQCARITTDGIRALTAGCRQIKALNVAGVRELDDRAIESIATSLKELSSFNLNGCDLVTDRGIAMLASECRNLRSLFLGGLRITDVSIQSLNDYGTFIETLNISCCKNITDAGIRSLHTPLRMLNLNGCSISDYGLKGLAERATDIRVVYINRCENVTASGVQVFRRLRPGCEVYSPIHVPQ